MLWHCQSDVYFRNERYSRSLINNKTKVTLTPSKRQTMYVISANCCFSFDRPRQTCRHKTPWWKQSKFGSWFLLRLLFFWLLWLCSSEASLETLVHTEGALQLLDNTLVKGYLLPEVGLHHVFEVHLSLLMEMAHLCLEGEPNSPAAFPNAVGLALVHLPLVAHALALLHLGKGPWVKGNSYKADERPEAKKEQVEDSVQPGNKTEKKERSQCTCVINRNADSFGCICPVCMIVLWGFHFQSNRTKTCLINYMEGVSPTQADILVLLQGISTLEIPASVPLTSFQAFFFVCSRLL